MAVGATLLEQEIICKMLVHMVLLYISKSLVVTDVMLKFLEGFHHIYSRIIVGVTARQVGWGGGGGHWWRRPWRTRFCGQ